MIWAIIGLWTLISNVVAFGYIINLPYKKESIYDKEIKRMSNGELLFYFVFLPASLFILFLNFMSKICTKYSIGSRITNWLNKKPFEKDSK